MSRLLFIIVIIAVVFWWFRSVRKRQQQQDRQEEQQQQQQPPRAEDMVRCVECGVHLPKNESYFVGGKYYCSEAHSRSQSGKPE